MLVLFLAVVGPKFDGDRKMIRKKKGKISHTHSHTQRKTKEQTDRAAIKVALEHFQVLYEKIQKEMERGSGTKEKKLKKYKKKQNTQQGIYILILGVKKYTHT